MISNEKREVFIMATLTDRQVRTIFDERAQGKTQEAIAKQMGCSDSHISNILLRRLYSTVKIDNETLDKAEAYRTSKKKVRRKSPKKKPAPLSPVSRHVAIAEFSEACFRMDEARQACMSIGISDDMLSLMREAVKTDGS
jgi:transcriptional regulator with XRE-family HTH domain